MDSNEARLANGLVTVAEVATELRVTRMSVYRLIQSGDLPAIRVGRAYRITEGGLSAYKTRIGLTVNNETMNDTDQAAVEDGFGTDYDPAVSAAREPLPAFPDHHPNPHNHIFTISMDGRGPMIVVRGNTPENVNERFQALQDAGTTAIAAAVYSHMKAEMAVANGVWPGHRRTGPPGPARASGAAEGHAPAVRAERVSPAGAGLPGPAGFFPPRLRPRPSSGAPRRAAPLPVTARSRGRLDWPQVYKIDVPFNAKEQFKAFREQYKDAFKGKVSWAGGGGYWVHGDVVQSFANYNPVPA